MKPRLRYFKLAEAQNLSGEFSGWSERSRDERLGLLIRIIEHHKFLGVTSAMPLAPYKEVFGSLPDKGVHGPYFLSFYGIISHLAAYLQGKGETGPIDFIFDVQPGHTKIVLDAWENFLAVAPPEFRPLLGDYPAFRDDRATLPLQAADLGAGWSRQLAEDAYFGRQARKAPWADVTNPPPDILVLGRMWTKQMMLELRGTLNLTGHASRPSGNE